MSAPEAPDGDSKTQPTTDDNPDDDTVVKPPSYPAYSTPPPEGLPDAEHG